MQKLSVKPMPLEKSYLKLVRLENIWSRLLQIKRRNREVGDSCVQNIFKHYAHKAEIN